jgi:hypothetical protein
MAEFDAAEVLKGSAKDITAGLGSLTYAQVKALGLAELAKGPEGRISVLKALQAEVEARKAHCPAIDLSGASLDCIAAAMLCEPGTEPTEGDRELAREILIDERYDDPVDRQMQRGVRGMAELLLEIERLHAAMAGGPRETVPEGQIAAPDRDPAKTLKAFAELAFVDVDGDVRFKITAEPGLFTLRGRKASYQRKVTLVREKPGTLL